MTDSDDLTIALSHLDGHTMTRPTVVHLHADHGRSWCDRWLMGSEPPLYRLIYGRMSRGYRWCKTCLRRKKAK